jgi:biotin carboxylase
MEDMEFEEYIDGTVFHIDGLVYRSEIIFCLASQYHGTCLDYINGRPLASTSVEDVAEQRRWLAFASDVHKAMRLPDGAFHLEAFLTKNSERLFLEIGARPGGAYIVPSIARATGVNLDVAHLQCQLGIRPSLQPQSAQHYAWLIFPKAVETGTHAIVEKIEAPDLTRLGSLAWSQLPVAGDKYSGPFSYMSNLGAFVFVSPDKDLITANLRSLLEEYHVLPGASA